MSEHYHVEVKECCGDVTQSLSAVDENDVFAFSGDEADSENQAAELVGGGPAPATSAEEDGR